MSLVDRLRGVVYKDSQSFEVDRIKPIVLSDDKNFFVVTYKNEIGPLYYVDSNCQVIIRNGFVYFIKPKS